MLTCTVAAVLIVTSAGSEVPLQAGAPVVLKSPQLPLPWWDAEAEAGSASSSSALAGGTGAARNKTASKQDVPNAVEWIMGEYLVGFWIAFWNRE
jgi:hypothetical protein